MMTRFDETEVLAIILRGFGHALSKPGVITRIRFESMNRVVFVVLDAEDKNDLTFLGAYAGMIAGELRRDVVEGRKPRLGIDIRPICGLVVRTSTSLERRTTDSAAPARDFPQFLAPGRPASLITFP